ERCSGVLVDGREMLRQDCLRCADAKFQAAAQALGALPFLLPQGTLAQFLEKTQAALAYLGWKQHAFEIASVTRDWPQNLDAKFSRTLFLLWLEETATTFAIDRSNAGDHPYARVELLALSHPQNQEWSHLIFAG